MFSNCSVCFWKSCIYSNQLWMCKKQISVSHISTESEISLWMRFDVIPSLDVWDLIDLVFRNTIQISDKDQRSHGMINVLNYIDGVPSSVQFSHQPGLTELLLIGCLIELIWIPRSKSNTSTPKTNSQTY